MLCQDTMSTEMRNQMEITKFIEPGVVSFRQIKMHTISVFIHLVIPQ